MKVKRESEVAQSCLTLSDLMDCSLPGSSVHGIFQARVLESGAIAFSIICIYYIHISYVCIGYFTYILYMKPSIIYPKKNMKEKAIKALT